MGRFVCNFESLLLISFASVLDLNTETAVARNELWNTMIVYAS